MRHTSFASRSISLMAVVACVACSGESAVNPPLTADGLGRLESRASALAGSYEVSFVSNNQPVTSVPVSTEVGVVATVRSSTGELATSGMVTYEICDLNGDPAPSATCDSGTGRWKRYIFVRMDPSGFPPRVAFMCSTPHVVGFRFKYGGSSTIASGQSASADITFTAI
jgi:hypothetical protein